MCDPEPVSTVDDFKRYNVDRLKDFLRKRGIKCSGRKDELVALAFSASVLALPIKESVKDDNINKSNDYRSLLNICGVNLPDPLTDITEGWLGEAQGQCFWPPTMYGDIAEYVLTLKTSGTSEEKHEELQRRLLSDYKEGKAYSYFDSKWLKEVYYHEVNPSSPVCFLKSECTPSENIRNIPHKIWVCIEKNTGAVQGAYCTCFAGLGATCNHIAAVLFKLDFWWQHVHTGKSCTDKPCRWNSYGATRDVAMPKPVSDMEWRKPHYKKGFQQESINPVVRQLFKPVSSNAPSLNSLTAALFASGSNACAFQYVSSPDPPAYDPSEDFNVASFEEVIASTQTPKSLTQLARRYNDVEKFLTELPIYSLSEVDSLSRCTTGQGDNPTWFEHRVGRLTASRMHSVLTKVRTLRAISTEHKDATSLVGTIMGYNPVNPDIPALKYGRLKEKDARKKYAKVLQEQGHKDIKVVQCGLHVVPDQCYLGASPDALVECSCCGQGILEIKCPLSVANNIPDSSNLAYLQKGDSASSKLKENHSHFTQVQTQLGCTNRQWCDFFVYTNVGFYLERIHFDTLLWDEIKSSAKFFFDNYVADSLVNKCLQNSVASPLQPSQSSLQSLPTVTVPALSKGNPPASTSCRRRRNKRKRKVEAMPVYICVICSQVCRERDSILNENGNSVQCEKCLKWFHWGCAGFGGDEEESWFCQICQPEY